ncbi:hypothetical protein ACIG5E_38635 [Kitasatospora sp. NPDC053057]|uniref:hypothetical protein n=1 Tax=Kitasatospora sp. NPDC053057 TaxID=3364062 RepID=UPI0037C72E66
MDTVLVQLTEQAARHTGDPAVTPRLGPGGVCQQQGQRVDIPPYSNDWWAYLSQYGGYLTNIYLGPPGNQVPGVPAC